MLAMSLKLQPEDFQHILRICNTNIDGRTTVTGALIIVSKIEKNDPLLVRYSTNSVVPNLFTEGQMCSIFSI